MFLYVVQIIQLASFTELHCQHTSAGVAPVDTRSLDEREVLEHGRELLLVSGLLLEVQFVGEVCAHLSSQPLEVKVREDVGDTRHQQLRAEGWSEGVREGGSEGGRE